MIKIKCKCGNGFNYTGNSNWYAKCPKCRSRISIKKSLERKKLEIKNS